MSGTITTLREALAREGAAEFTDASGKKLFFVMSKNLGKMEDGVLVAYEGAGAMYWDFQGEINQFTLIKRGFSINVAPTLAHMMNELFKPQNGLPKIG